MKSHSPGKMPAETQIHPVHSTENLQLFGGEVGGRREEQGGRREESRGREEQERREEEVRKREEEGRRREDERRRMEEREGKEEDGGRREEEGGRIKEEGGRNEEEGRKRKKSLNLFGEEEEVVGKKEDRRRDNLMTFSPGDEDGKKKTVFDGEKFILEEEMFDRLTPEQIIEKEREIVRQKVENKVSEILIVDVVISF